MAGVYLGCFDLFEGLGECAREKAVPELKVPALFSPHEFSTLQGKISIDIRGLVFLEVRCKGKFP